LVLLTLLLTVVAGGRLAFPSYRVAGASMAPTLADGQRLLVNRLAYTVGEPHRGDLVVVKRGDLVVVKRVVALPGETVTVRDGVLTIDGTPLAESYLSLDERTECEGGAGCTVTVPADAVYVLGDNRDASVDSRVFGPILLEVIIGEVVEFP